MSTSLVLETNYEIFNPDTDLYEAADGYVCKECGCFHEINGSYWSYDPMPPNILRNCFK